MPSRVGMTSDIKERSSFWYGQYPNLYNFIIRAEGLNYEQAQALENRYRAMGYLGSPGGAPIPGFVYVVYTFDYIE